MAESNLSEHAKRQMGTQRAAAEKSREEFAQRTKGKPTPTQDENDRAKMGETFAEHEHDGSDIDEGAVPLEHRHMQSGGASGGTYQTRQATPQPSSPRGSYPAGARAKTE